jgi:hypothetical protein
LSFGGTSGLPLIHKVVKPIKVTGSRTTNKLRFDELLVSEAQSELRATDASVLREPDAAMRHELTSFDMTGRRLNHTAKFFPLLVGDGGLEVLNLRELLSDKRDQRHVGDPADPGVADQLGIKSEQTIRFFWIAGRCGLPFQ